MIDALPAPTLPTLASCPTESIEDELATLAAGIAAATGRFLELLAELDRREAWADQGFLSLADWLAWRCGMDQKTAREHIRTARAARELPRTLAALRAGEISYSKARALTRVARPETEEKLIEIARNATAGQLERILAAYRRADSQAERKQSDENEARRHADAYFDDDGMLVIRARLSSDEGAVFLRALDSARDALFRADGPPPEIGIAERRADALVLLADRSLAAAPADRSGADRVTVILHVDEAVLADPTADGQSRLDAGPQAPAETSRRLACDAAVVEVTHGADGDIQTGRRTRVVSSTLRRALNVRDRGTCTFPGCSCRIVDVHHVQHWANGGPTVLRNTLFLCRRHHVRVHEGGYRVELSVSGEIRFYRPDGTMVSPVPPPQPRVEQLPFAGMGPRSLVAADATTRIDTAWIVSVLV